MESIFNYLKKEGAASTLFFNYDHINMEVIYSNTRIFYLQKPYLYRRPSSEKDCIENKNLVL